MNNDPWMENGGPAFPCDDGEKSHYKGMSLRDYFAAKVLSSLAANSGGRWSLANTAFSEIAEVAYEVADAMLAERVK